MRSLLLPFILSVASLASSTPASSTPVNSTSGTAPVIAAAHSRIPIEFEVNAGQLDPAAAFVARGNNFRAYFTKSGPVMVFEKMSAAANASSKNSDRRVRGTVLRMNFAGMNAVPEGLDRTAGVGNYLIGSDPKRWHVGVPHFGKVIYRNAYPGIDVVFYSGQSGLEYDVIAAPGADVSRVRISFDGADSVKVEPNGRLTIQTPAGALHQNIAKVYEEKNGRRRAVESRFEVSGDRSVKVAVDRHDKQARLVFDPVLEYSTLLGGSDLDQAKAIAVNSNGQAYVTGGTNSADFPTTAGAFDRVCTGSFNCGDAFVTKLNSSGTGLIYSTFIGGSGGDGAFGIALDSSGNAYITGSTNSTDFPGTFIGPARGANEAFVAKLNATGTGLLYAVSFGGSTTNEGIAIAVDSARNAYVAGNSQSQDFPTTPGAFQTTAAPDWHAFAVKLNAAGNAFVYSTRIGGTTSTDFSHGIALDSSGNAYVAGEAGSDDFPTTPGVVEQTKAAGSRAGFVTKLNATGSAPIYSTFWGDLIFGIATDSGHNAYVTGAASILPTTSGAIQSAQHGNGDAFISKLSPTGQALRYSTFLGGSQSDFGSGIAVNSAGEAYVLGGTFSGDFPVTATGFQQVYVPGACGDTASSPCPDAFVAKVNATGTVLSYGSYLGGNGSEFVDTSSDVGGSDIALDSNGIIYVAGATNSLNFPTTNTAFKQKLGSMDGFVAKITPLCALKTTVPSVTICTPGNGATVHSPVTIIAGSRGARRVKLVQVYVDGVKKYEAALSAIEVKLAIPAGTHRVTVQALDTANVTFKTPITVTVAP